MIDMAAIDVMVAEIDTVVLPDWVQGLYDRVEQYVRMRSNYYKFLYRLVEKRRPFTALELGVEFGIASACMVAAAKIYGGSVIGVDLNSHDIPARELPVYGRYDFVIGDSVHVVDDVHRLVRRYGPIGVVFQDSSHHYAPSIEEWNLYSRLLDENSVWVCDDITPAFFESGVDEGSMVDYFNQLPGEKRLYPDRLHNGNTVGVVIV